MPAEYQRSLQFEREKREARSEKGEGRRKKEEEEAVKMNLRWMEAVLPLGIIAGMLCVMGNAQYYIHKAAHGRPKHIGNDMWDVAMERRDKKLLEHASSSN
ncbi:hypothetical protein VNO78_15468 [Psophocarpus tetragonolobus]|uniref:NADH dehydrogenase [ubiquinone] 1 alpha subcomplex subunit 1 n=1 Tax=Psophocarpus tetragonolobus TaxID=3891 RepID=A0AAN9SF20_PSOTE